MISEENGQIIVDELRPMSEHCKDGSFILVHHKEGECLREAYYFEKGIYVIGKCEVHVHESDIIGWIPALIYRPKDGV